MTAHDSSFDRPTLWGELPSGTVTFLLTDIEGSTALWDKYPDAMSHALNQHELLVAGVVAENRGHTIKERGEGDATLSVFPRAIDAVHAAIALQVALNAEPWPGGLELSTRMALHSGEAELRDGDYYGGTLNRAARIRGLAAGGQILCSQAVAELIADTLPPGAELHDLGARTLRGLRRAEEVHVLTHSDLPPIPLRSPQDRPSRNATVDISAPPRVMTSYRTEGTPPGYFRTPGDIHVHIDGARNVAELVDLLRELGEQTKEGTPRFPGKFNRILSFSGGPQRDDMAFAETYRCHTPGSVHREAFDSFSTMRLGHGVDLEPDAVAVLRRILESISTQSEAVVELERVSGVLEPGGKWNEADPPRIADPRDLDSQSFSDFRRLTTSPIEIHHSIDIPKNADTGEEQPVVTVDQLPVWPNLGGWFLFDRGDSWSFRSSEFVGRTAEYHYAASVGQKRLGDYLAELGFPYELRTLVEQVLGIWRGGEQPTDAARSIPALGEWELACPANGHVWVIAGNFLGDRSPDVRRAMLQNLAEDVTYTYFLRTHADVLRLGLLADELERGLLAEGCSGDKAHRSVAENLRCVLLAPELTVDGHLRDLLNADCFLCPYDAQMGGYRLDSSGLSGEPMNADDLECIVTALNPLLEAKVRGLFSSSEESWAPKSFFRAVVCTDLEETAVHQDQEPWRRMLAEYDRIVASEVSMHGSKCLVVRPVRNGYLVVFEEPTDAAAWSRRLQFEVHRRNAEIAKRSPGALSIPKHNVALGYGWISRVLRAHGYDYIGGAIDDCIGLAPKLQQGLIAMSRPFADQYESHVGKREFLASTSGYSDAELGEFRVLEWP
jgi:class 3 adenylate cyclase